MDAATAILGGSGTINLGGRVWLVAQPTPADAGTVAAFLQQKCKTPVQALQEDPEFQLLPESERKELLADAARKKFGGQPVDAMDAIRALTTVDGCRFLAWVLLRKNHPELTLEQVTEWITPENALRVSVELDVASGMAALGNSAGRSG